MEGRFRNLFDKSRHCNHLRWMAYLDGEEAGYWLMVQKFENDYYFNRKEINTEYSLEGLMLKLKLQYFGHLMWRTDSFENTLMLGKIEGRRSRDDRGWDGWMALWTQWRWVWVNSVIWWWTGSPGLLQSMGSQRVRHDCATELNWISLQSKGLSLVFLSTTIQKHQFFGTKPSLWSNSHIHTCVLEKPYHWLHRTFCWQGDVFTS